MIKKKSFIISSSIIILVVTAILIYAFTKKSDNMSQSEEWERCYQELLVAITKRDAISLVEISPQTYNEYKDNGYSIILHLTLETGTILDESMKEDLLKQVKEYLDCEKVDLKIGYMDEEQRIAQDEADDGTYIRSVVNVDGSWYCRGEEVFLNLPEGYQKIGEIQYSDKEELPEQNHFMIPNEGVKRKIYQNPEQAEDIYLDTPYGAKGKLCYFRYIKEENPEIYTEQIAGFYDYIYIDDKEMHTVTEGVSDLPEKILNRIEKVGILDSCNEGKIVKKNGYTGNTSLLGAVVYKDEMTGIYYVHDTEHTDWWFEIGEYEE